MFIRAAVVSMVSAVLLAVGSYAQVPVVPAGTVPVKPGAQIPVFKGAGSGMLESITKDGKKIGCPLKHTDVSAKISGHVSRVTVKQVFANPFKDKIEAVYTFPLSDTGAVDDMLMKIGERTIHGTIKKKEEARHIYERAKAAGHVAALLDQERANIFTQSVANIEPNKEIEVTISYVDLLPYEAGTYTFAFPTVVGPRFIPGTQKVPDAAKITPPVAAEGERAGHDISINVSIDSPVAVNSVHSQLHQVTAVSHGDRHYDVSLVDKATIPNKDFVLTWAVGTDDVKSGYLTNGKNGQGFFNLSIMPPKRPKATQVQPKEMIFLIDCSGSQSGQPLDKAKEVMRYALDHMNDEDTFQVIAFSSYTNQLFGKPQKATGEMRKKAREFIDGLTANGGTWMEPAVREACSIPSDDHRLRIVTFMTDGYVGNDMQIVGLIRKLRGTSRWFPFGTGNSVNRFLIDNIAKEGGGEADYVYLNSSAEAAGKKFYDKIASPVLTDVKIDFNGLAVKEVFPKDPSDVWAEKPLYITGRYIKAGKGTITISGFSGGKPYTQKLEVEFPENKTQNDVLGAVWARAKVDRLMAEDWLGAQAGKFNKELRDEIVRTALDHHIMTQFTSFVAVEERIKTQGGKPQRIEVPVELPDGVSREGVFGNAKPTPAVMGKVMPTRFYNAPKQMQASGSGYYLGYGGGAAGGALAPAPPALPASTTALQTVNARRISNSSGGGGANAGPGINEWGQAKGDNDKNSVDEEKKDVDVRSVQAPTRPKLPSEEFGKIPRAYIIKLSAAMQKWLNIDHARGDIQVKVTLATAHDFDKLLKVFGVTVIKHDEKSKEAILKITFAGLQKLVAMPEVMNIDKSE